MNISPYLVNMMSPIMLSLVVGLVAFYCKELFYRNPALAYVGIILLAFVVRLGNTPRPHLVAYIFTFLLFAILRKDSEEEGNVVYWILPLTVAWVNLHGGSYLLIFVFLFINILSGLFTFNLGKISFKKSSKNQQLKRVAVLIVGLALVIINAHGYRMYLYPITNFADTLMQGSISEWFAPDLKQPWQIYIYIMMAIFVSALMSTKKEIKAVDFLTGFAYTYLTLRSIRFAPQMAIVTIMIVGSYTDSLDAYIKDFNKKLIMFMCIAMFLISGVSAAFSLTNVRAENLFNLSQFPTDQLIEKIKEIEPERLYNPYNSGGYLTYRGISVFVDGRADIYTSINLSDSLRLNRGSYDSIQLIKKYDFDYMLVFRQSTLDALLGYNEDMFTLIESDERFHLYKVTEMKNN